MRSRVSLFEEFLTLLENLKDASKDSPERLVNFYEESEGIRTAVNALENFLIRSDFERRIFHGRRKAFYQVPDKFEPAWNEYNEKWAPALAHLLLREIIPELVGEFEQSTKGSTLLLDPGAPDYEEDEEFDPRFHDGGAALEEGIRYLVDNSDKEPPAGNVCRIAASAYDYLTETIGIGLNGVFQRWRRVPIVFMPAHVSDRHGLMERGSFHDLLDEAVRAYVCGAPAAAIAMCRAALEMVLKRHYGQGKWDDLKLGKVIVLADQKFEYVQSGRIQPLVDRSNGILHNYSGSKRLTNDEESTILNFLKTVKFLIQRAPAV